MQKGSWRIRDYYSNATCFYWLVISAFLLEDHVVAIKAWQANIGTQLGAEQHLSQSGHDEEGPGSWKFRGEIEGVECIFINSR